MKSAKRRYFAASNSAQGFKSYYSNVFDPSEYSRIYVIKGGAGTGKSYFMKRVAEHAELCGFSVIYIHCSSDPASIDGIIIEETGIAVLDGTAPHATECSAPGAIESIIDLGAFWNTSMLAGSRRIIESMNTQKAKCFERAYGYLAAYKSVSENMKDLIAPYVKTEKIKKYISRFVPDAEGEGRERYLLTDSIGMGGRVSFDTYRECAGVYYAIKDYFETGHVLLSALYGELKKKRADIILSFDPVLSDRINAITLASNGLTFRIAADDDEDDGRVINMKRFTDAAQMQKARSDYRMANRLRSGIEELALYELERAKKYHFTLEEIYGAAMDFSAKDRFCTEFCNKIFSAC